MTVQQFIATKSLTLIFKDSRFAFYHNVLMFENAHCGSWKTSSEAISSGISHRSIGSAPSFKDILFCFRAYSTCVILRVYENRGWKSHLPSSWNDNFRPEYSAKISVAYFWITRQLSSVNGMNELFLLVFE